MATRVKHTGGWGSAIKRKRKKAGKKAAKTRARKKAARSRAAKKGAKKRKRGGAKKRKSSKKRSKKSSKKSGKKRAKKFTTTFKVANRKRKVKCPRGRVARATSERYKSALRARPTRRSVPLRSSRSFGVVTNTFTLASYDVDAS
jgi:hypothetical protein